MSLRNSPFSDMSSENTAILLPPALFAARSAWSARRSRSEVVSRPGTPSATPMLTVRVSISPSMDTRSRSVACSRLARVFRLVGGHRRHRDDDELVAAESGDQVGPFGPFAEPLREHPDEPVAGRMTQIVVDRLEPVQVEEQRGDGAGLVRPPAAGRGGPAGRGGC